VVVSVVQVPPNEKLDQLDENERRHEQVHGQGATVDFVGGVRVVVHD
jgi:hypothetical protein